MAHPIMLRIATLLFLLTTSIASAEPTGCVYDRAAFNAIRHQARLARQNGRHDKATILDFAAAILRCQSVELERELAKVMPDVWNNVADQPSCPDGFFWTQISIGNYKCCLKISENTMGCTEPVYQEEKSQ